MQYINQNEHIKVPVINYTHRYIIYQLDDISRWSVVLDLIYSYAV